MTDTDQPKLFCKKCNFQAKGSAQWLKHIETSKHNRDGQKKEKTCEICNKTFSNHFTLKIHNLSAHSSKEERSKHKFYCNDCDYVFISELYHQQHCKGITHKNVVKVNESLLKNL